MVFLMFILVSALYEIVYINRPIVFFKTAADVRTMKSLFHGAIIKKYIVAKRKLNPSDV